MEKFKAYSIILSAFFIPVNPRFAAGFIGLALIFWLIEGNWTKKFTGYSRSTYFGIISFYLFGLISLFWTENYARAFELAQTRFPLFILPTLFFGWSEKQPVPFKQILTAFCLACILGCLIMPLRAGFDFYFSGLQNFFYQDLSSYINMHPTYYTMYLAFSVMIIWSEQIFAKKWQAIMATTLLVVNIGLLSSRMGTIAFVFTGIIGLLFYGIQKKRIAQIILFCGLSLSFLVSALYFIPAVNYRFKVLIEEFQESDIKKKNVRAQLWNASRSVFHEDPLIGQGLGDGKNALMSMTHKKGYIKPYQKKFNAHNQYWQNLIDGGVFGLIFFLLLLLLPLYWALKKKNLLGILFVILISANMFTENIIDAQKGTLFVGYFLGLIPLVLTKKKTPVS